MNGGEDFLTSKKLIARKIDSRKKNTKPSTKQFKEEVGKIFCRIFFFLFRN